MCLRISEPKRILIAAAGLFALAACGRGEPDEPRPGSDLTVACSVEGQGAGQANFSQNCGVVQEKTAQGLTLTIHHPDGGFRRLRVTQDGRGVITADGAEDAEVSITGDSQIDVTIGGDRYRLPATIKASAQ